MEERILSDELSVTEDSLDKGLLNRTYTDASKAKRFANYLLDIIAFYLIIIILAVIAGIVLGLTGNAEMAISREENKIVEYIAGAILILLYYIISETLTGRTIGKLITGTKVITVTGERPGFSSILKRSFCRLIPFEPFSFLGDGPGWHDSASDTRVVNVK
jgi:uncharacterized RDD family membrane protein YckC